MKNKTISHVTKKKKGPNREAQEVKIQAKTNTLNNLIYKDGKLDEATIFQEQLFKQELSKIRRQGGGGKEQI